MTARFTTLTGAGVEIDIFDAPANPLEFSCLREIEAYTGVALLPVVSLHGQRAHVTVWPDANAGMSRGFIVSKAALPGGWLELCERAA